MNAYVPSSVNFYVVCFFVVFLFVWLCTFWPASIAVLTRTLRSENTHHRPMSNPYYWFISDPLFITIPSQSYNITKKCQKFKCWNFAKTVLATHPLKLLDKMHKYEMDLASIVDDTERTGFRPQTDARTDGPACGSLSLDIFLWSSKSFTLSQPANHWFIKINLLCNICTNFSHACCSLCR